MTLELTNPNDNRSVVAKVERYFDTYQVDIIKTATRYLVGKADMVPIPSYYSGMGVNRKDLDETKLERIYLGVRDIFGDESARQYVEMVKDIPRLTATDFLRAMYHLEANDWEWDKHLLGDGSGIYVIDHASAFLTLAALEGKSNEKDDTDAIKDNFLKRVEQPRLYSEDTRMTFNESMYPNSGVYEDILYDDLFEIILSPIKSLIKRVVPRKK